MSTEILIVEADLRVAAEMTTTLRAIDSATEYVVSTACDLSGAMLHSSTRFARFDIVSVGGVPRGANSTVVYDSTTLIAHLRTYHFMGRVIAYAVEPEFLRVHSRRTISGRLVEVLKYDEKFLRNWAEHCAVFAQQRVT